MASGVAVASRKREDHDHGSRGKTTVTGTITALTDNTANDGTVTVTFTRTRRGTTTDTTVTLDSTTKIVLNDKGPTALADFVTAVQAALADPTLPQYSGRARIESGATVASRVCVSNVEDD